MIEDQDSTVCVSLTNHIHGKKFFNKKVFVTSVVQKTPSKNTVSSDDNAPAESVNDCPTDLVASSEPDSSSDSEQDPSTVTKPPCSKLFNNISTKRGPPPSPEESSENKKNDKKKQKASDITSATSAVRSSSRQGINLNKQ